MTQEGKGEKVKTGRVKRACIILFINCMNLKSPSVSLGHVEVRQLLESCFSVCHPPPKGDTSTRGKGLAFLASAQPECHIQWRGRSSISSSSSCFIRIL